MKEFKEFIQDLNCDGILRESLITIKYKGNVLCEIFRNETLIKNFKPGENIGVVYNDNEIRYIKNSYFSNDGLKIFVELFSEIELENLYKDYLESKLEYEMINDEYTTFYPTYGMDFEEIKKNGWVIKLDFNIFSYFEFKEHLLINILDTKK